MPTIREYNGGKPDVRIDDTGARSWALAAGRTASAEQERVSLIREGGKDLARGVNELGTGMKQFGDAIQEHQDYTEHLNGINP